MADQDHINPEVRMEPSGALDEAIFQEGVKKLRRKFTRTISLYNPINFTKEALELNRVEWTGEVKEAFDDYVGYLDGAYNNDHINQADEDILDGMINAVSADFAEFLNKFSTKCSVATGSVSDNSSNAGSGGGTGASVSINDSSQSSAVAENARQAGSKQD